MRNDPCPCGSGKKFKKCHGAAVPPEVAALPSDARAEWQRAEVVLQRQKRVCSGQRRHKVAHVAWLLILTIMHLLIHLH